ncbi:YqkE family protein [Sutcliffiella horikoshii]|uniref:YqkE family protein n=1 Tax=Sutcliffiella horikoshii TaxID=79883 RepID=UPI001F309EF7|nr:YqkE family protein [Sutcliffiella horikoshii]
MKKKQKKNHSPAATKREEKVSVKDQLERDVFSKLKSMKDKLVQSEQQQKEQEAARIKEEKRLKEKNKSFEELFEESNQNWKEFK